jgi:rhodanese-related sulfurtransferase
VEFLAFLQKNIFLVAVAAVSGGMLIWPMIGRLFNPGQAVTALQAVQLINRRDAVVVDVRDAAEYSSGHIPNAKHVPAAELASRLKELEKYKNRPVVLFCRTGNRSANACAILQKHGFNEVFSLRGGLGAWEQASMPIEKG